LALDVVIYPPYISHYNKNFNESYPIFLVYGMEAVIHLKVDIPSLRLLIDSELEKAEWAKVRYEV
jgi:hypothetical protein